VADPVAVAAQRHEQLDLVRGGAERRDLGAVVDLERVLLRVAMPATVQRKPSRSFALRRRCGTRPNVELGDACAGS
jgi:hypothetical protein